MRRTPLKRKRETPRRNEGRVAHGRIKEKTSRPASKEEREHMEVVAALGCLVCSSPATIHHVTSDGHQRTTRSHQKVVPLCPRHHMIQHGPHESVEALGHAGFTARYGIDLLKWASDAWERRGNLKHPFWTHGVTRLRELAISRGM